MHDWKGMLLTVTVLALAAGLLGYGFYMDESSYWIPGFVVLVIPLAYWSWRYSRKTWEVLGS
jgi:hypothetical protein